MLLVLTVTTEQQQDRSTTLEQQQELVNNSRIAVRKNLVKTDAKLTLNGPKCEIFRLRRALVARVAAWSAPASFFSLSTT